MSVPAVLQIRILHFPFVACLSKQLAQVWSVEDYVSVGFDHTYFVLDFWILAMN